MRAALLAAGSSAVLSHRTAAFAYGLIPSMPPVVEVTVTRTGPRSRPGLVVHETRRPPEVRTHRGLPLTAPLRTLQDLMTEQRARAASEALVLGLVSEEQLIRAGLMADETAPTRSEVERRFLLLVRRAGLPRPLVNQRLGPYRPDFLWPDHRTVVETDGWRVHGRRSTFESDHARDADLAAQGYTVLRFTWRQLRDEPLLVAARLGQVLALRRSQPPRAPAAASRAPR
jgi:very-short-patch-repair endonuclease